MIPMWRFVSLAPQNSFLYFTSIIRFFILETDFFYQITEAAFYRPDRPVDPADQCNGTPRSGGSNRIIWHVRKRPSKSIKYGGLSIELWWQNDAILLWILCHFTEINYTHAISFSLLKVPIFRTDFSPLVFFIFHGGNRLVLQICICM